MNLVHHFHEMAHFVDHAACFRRVLALDHLVQTAQAQPANGLPHVVGTADKADHPLDSYRALGGVFFLCRHCASPAAFSAFFSRPVISSTVLVRVSATCAASFNPSNAANVALMTLCGFEVPSDLVSTFVIPATCITLRTGPPAITPVPSGAGLSSTCVEQYTPTT